MKRRTAVRLFPQTITAIGTSGTLEKEESIVERTPRPIKTKMLKVSSRCAKFSKKGTIFVKRF